MGSIHVPDMYKVKHPEEFAEKFPQKKEEPKEKLSLSEQLRLDAEKETSKQQKVEEPKKEEPKVEEPKVKSETPAVKTKKRK